MWHISGNLIFINSKRKTSLFIIGFLSILSMPVSIAENTPHEHQSGLYFYSHEVDKEERTSLHIPISEIDELGRNFTIGFDFKIRTSNQNFGYIFRMIGEKEMNLDLIISDLRMDSLVSVILSNKPIIQFNTHSLSNFGFDTWNNACISLVDDTISMTINGITKSRKIPDNKYRFLDIYFGANKHAEFSTTEISPMTVKNIRLFSKQKEIRYWPLDRHGKNIVCDEYKKEKAYTINPKWEIDNHYKWQKKESITFEMFPQIAFDSINERVFIAQYNRMLIYDVQREKLDTIHNIQGNPYYVYANQMVYDSRVGQLISYNFSNDRLATYNFQQRKWNYNDPEKIMPQYWHHGKLFISEDSMLVTIGGYGYFKYKGVMMKYPLSEKKWEKVDISKTIYPRYLGSIGYLGEGKVLYFGGYGSESGNQEESPRNYYDLYQIDVHNDSIVKLWEKATKNNEVHYTNSNSMVIDKKKGVFYVLTYENRLKKSNIQIKEFKINSPEYRFVGDTIPYIFSDNRSFCDLFLSSKAGKLVAITTYTGDKENVSNIDIYTINYSPFATDEIYQQETIINTYQNYIITIIIVGLIICIILYVLKKKKRLKQYNGNGKENSNDNTPLSLDLLKDVPVGNTSPSIILLGGFQVIDEKRIDITKMFPPTVKHL
ncbi:hypothetical protein EZS27_014014, partial [termite gut metagenome]